MRGRSHRRFKATILKVLKRSNILKATNEDRKVPTLKLNIFSNFILNQQVPARGDAINGHIFRVNF